MSGAAAKSDSAGAALAREQPPGPAPVPAAILLRGVIAVGAVAFLSGGAVGAVVTASMSSPTARLLCSGAAALCAALAAMILWRVGATRHAYPLRAMAGALISVPVAAFFAMTFVVGAGLDGARTPGPADFVLFMGVIAVDIACSPPIGLFTLPVAAATGFLVARWCRRRIA